MAEPLASRIAQRRTAALSEGGADYSAKRAELIRVAAIVFREKGYARATLNDVAALFGTDRASLYYYVASKEELFQECISGIVSTNIANLEAVASSDLSAKDKLLRFVEIIIHSQVANYPYEYVYIQEDMRQVVSQEALWAQTMVEQTHRIEKFFTDAVAAGAADGSFRADLSNTLIANSLFGMLLWTHRWFVPGRKYSAEDLIKTFTAVLFEGIQTAK